jgi:hypothetical protein
MHCGSSWRTPSRRTVLAYAGRLALLACLIALVLGTVARPASAYVCGRAPVQTRALQGHVGTLKDCDRPAARPKRGNADPMSFVFFMGLIVAFVLVPIALGRREELARE